MRRQSVAFFLGDVGFLSDPKFRKLQRRLPDADDFNSAVGAWFIALAAARRNGLPTLDVVYETDSRFVEDLIAVGLLTSEGFPESAFVSWAPSRSRRPNELRDELRRTATNGDGNDRMDSPSIPILSSIERTYVDGGRETGTREVSDAPDSLDVFYELTAWRPWGQFSGEQLNLAIRDYGDAPVTAALRAAHKTNPDRRGLLKQVLATLARNAEHARRSTPERSPKAGRQVDKQAYDAIRAEIARGE